MLTLFRICTGDAGAAILQDCLREAPLCDTSVDCEHNCCIDSHSTPHVHTITTHVHLQETAPISHSWPEVTAPTEWMRQQREWQVR